MKKYKKIIYIIILIAIFTTGCTKKQNNTDALRFKEEYESINGKTNEDSQKKYRKLNISTDNPFIYSSAEEIADKLKAKETFIVYFGFKECPWCRSVIEELIKVSQDKKVKEIYYVDVTGVRDVKELDEAGNIITKDEGTEGYKILIDKMSDVLDNYTLKQDEKEVEVGEKRIYAPNVVAVSKGKAIQLETGISENLKDPYGKLTEEIKQYSYNKFKCLVECLEEESTTCQKNKC